MAKVDMIEFGVLFADEENAKEYLDDLTGDDRVEVLDDLLAEWPFTVTVDREVWHSVDKTSADKVVLVVSWNQPEVVSGDTLENLADAEEREYAARQIAHDNSDWKARLDPIS